MNISLMRWKTLCGKGENVDYQHFFFLFSYDVFKSLFVFFTKGCHNSAMCIEESIWLATREKGHWDICVKYRFCQPALSAPADPKQHFTVYVFFSV